MDKNLSDILPNLVRFFFSSAMDIQNPKNRHSASFGALKPLPQKRSSKKRLLCPTLIICNKLILFIVNMKEEENQFPFEKLGQRPRPLPRCRQI